MDLSNSLASLSKYASLIPLILMGFHDRRETWLTVNKASNLSVAVVKQSAVLPLQSQNAAQVSVQNDAGYKRRGFV